MKTLAYMGLCGGLLLSSTQIQAAEPHTRSHYKVPYAKSAPVIDGVADEAIWDKAPWRQIDQVLIGDGLKSDDFSGRFKLVWTKSHLYLLAEIVDDVMADHYADPLEHYWDDEALELFVDEDNSGGDHQYNHSAFAYHIALDGNVVDSGPDRKAHLYNDHVQSRWQRTPEYTVWEAAIAIYDESFVDEDQSAKPVKLKLGKKMGFMVAYCDNDGGLNREHFIGSEEIVPVNGDKNRGWIDASVFGEIELVK
ncbi:CBM9 family sugar-binding protein [Teredinibacter turnerae]|uniref:CBM9 family sugar-binding protein n=1 Tax=Teredinibacter turnerae TaxID=2426 RepID=UPI00040FE39D|nr:CBM9 family sugar-binding protein [Teredinibacter turnerae]